jgi:hypothetical protein
MQIAIRAVAAFVFTAGPVMALGPEDPENVLEAKGLSRSGVFYVLSEDEALVNQTDQALLDLRRQFDQAELRYQQLQDRGANLRREIDSLRSRARGLRAEDRKDNRDRDADARRIEDEARDLERQLPEIQGDLQRVEATGRGLRNQIPEVELRLRRQRSGLMQSYEALGRDERIKEALRALNAGRKTNILVLGPAVDRAAYNAKVRQATDETLRALGMVLDKKSLIYTWPSEQALPGLVSRARRLRDEARPQSASELAEKRKGLVEQWQNAKPGPEKDQAKAKLDILDKKLKEALRPPRRPVAEAREEFLKVLDDLRRTVDQASEDKARQGRDGQFNVLIAIINNYGPGRKVRITNFPELKNAEPLVEEMERAEGPCP